MKLRKLFKFLAGTAVFTILSGSAMAAENIRIAYIDPLTGSFANVGDVGFKHFQWLADEINRNGGVLNGRKFEIVAFDNKINAKESVIQLNNAISQGIRFVTQGNGSSVANALIQAIKKHNKRNPDKTVLYLNYAAVTPKFTEEGCDFWHFRFDAHVDMKMAALTDAIAMQKNIKRVYLIDQDYIFGHAVSDSAKNFLKQKRPDIKIVGDTFHPIGKVKDFAPYVAKIKKSGADIVITGNWGADMYLLIKAANDAGLKAPFYTFYGGGLGVATVVGDAGEQRIKQVTEWHKNLSVEENRPFDAKYFLAYDAKYGSKTPFYYHRIRTMMHMLAKAFNRAGSADPKAVAYALEGMTHTTYYGDVVMRAQDHQLIQPLYISTFTKAGQGTVKYDVEDSGFGFKTDFRVEAMDTATPSPCDMKRP